MRGGECEQSPIEDICMQINVLQSPTYVPLRDSMPIYHFKRGTFSGAEMLQSNKQRFE